MLRGSPAIVTAPITANYFEPWTDGRYFPVAYARARVEMVSRREQNDTGAVKRDRAPKKRIVPFRGLLDRAIRP
jgi:hypothetical protein